MDTGRSKKTLSSGTALIPFVVFVAIYLGSGVWLNIKELKRLFTNFQPQLQFSVVL